MSGINVCGKSCSDKATALHMLAHPSSSSDVFAVTDIKKHEDILFQS